MEYLRLQSLLILWGSFNHSADLGRIQVQHGEEIVNLIFVIQNPSVVGFPFAPHEDEQCARMFFVKRIEMIRDAMRDAILVARSSAIIDESTFCNCVCHPTDFYPAVMIRALFKRRWENERNSIFRNIDSCLMSARLSRIVCREEFAKSALSLADGFDGF